MNKNLNPLYSTPVALLLGSVIISGAILINGGYIKFGNLTGTTKTSTQTSGTAPTGEQAQKTEADIINGLKDTAKKLGLNQATFDSCLDSGSKTSLVQSDFDDGTEVGVDGTPKFFINGRVLSGAVPFAQFKTVIDEELNGSAPSTTKRETVSAGNLPIMGNQNAKVTIIEFSDYQCPFCARHFTQTESQIKKEYVDTGKVKVYYRDFPLSAIHPGAQKAAEAARCAGDQNKYWEYHDLVFQNQTTIF